MLTARVTINNFAIYIFIDESAKNPPTLISSESKELIPLDSLSIGEHKIFVVVRQS